VKPQSSGLESSEFHYLMPNYTQIRSVVGPAPQVKDDINPKGKCFEVILDYLLAITRELDYPVGYYSTQLLEDIA